MTTTISLSKETKAEFDDARPPNADSADEFIRMLLETWQGNDPVDREQTIDVEDARLLADHVDRTVAPYFDDLSGNNTVTLEASERRAIAEEVAEVLQR